MYGDVLGGESVSLGELVNALERFATSCIRHCPDCPKASPELLTADLPSGFGNAFRHLLALDHHLPSAPGEFKVGVYVTARH